MICSTIDVASITAHRGSLFHLLDDPRTDSEAYEFIDDALLVIADGRIQSLGPYSQIKPTLAADINIEEHPDAILCPGFLIFISTFPNSPPQQSTENNYWAG